MEDTTEHETFEEQFITYVLEKDNKLFVIEHVPARVSVETGEQLFAPETVERLQRTVWSKEPPKRMMETAVYDFAS